MIRRIISEAIEEYFDVKLWNEAIAKNKELREEVRRYLTGKKCDDCDAGWIDKSKDLICFTCNGRGFIESKIEPELMKSLSLSDFDKYTPPIAEKIIDNSQDWLYNSSLEYLQQISRYKEYKAQSPDNIPDELDTDELDTDIFT